MEDTTTNNRKFPTPEEFGEQWLGEQADAIMQGTHTRITPTAGSTLVRMNTCLNMLKFRCEELIAKSKMTNKELDLQQAQDAEELLFKIDDYFCKIFEDLDKS